MMSMIKSSFSWLQIEMPSTYVGNHVVRCETKNVLQKAITIDSLPPKVFQWFHNFFRSKFCSYKKNKQKPRNKRNEIKRKEKNQRTWKRKRDEITCLRSSSCDKRHKCKHGNEHREETHLTNSCSWLLTRHDTTVAPGKWRENTSMWEVL